MGWCAGVLVVVVVVAVEVVVVVVVVVGMQRAVQRAAQRDCNPPGCWRHCGTQARQWESDGRALGMLGAVEWECNALGHKGGG